jgi:hypothetical protein
VCLMLLLGFTQANNFYYISSGGFQNMCRIACDEGFFLSAGTSGICLPKTYVVQFQVAVTLPPASTFNVRKYIASMALLAGISGCAYAPTTLTANRLYETTCTTPNAVIRATVDTPNTVVTNSFSPDRRLLVTAGTADVVTEIRIESNATKAATVKQSITVNAVNAQLSANSVGTTTTVSDPTVVVQAIVPSSSSAARSTSRAVTSAKVPLTTQAASTPAPPLTTAAPPVPPPDTTPAPASSSSNVGIIIGAVGVGVLVLVSGIISAVLCFAAKKGGAAKMGGAAKSGNKKTTPVSFKTASATASKFQFKMAYPPQADATLFYSAPLQLQMQYPLQHIQIHRFQ